jgi:tetratricopeptide (TPR) repeat protein/transcriptional regulator with XRE-family HTH domain
MSRAGHEEDIPGGWAGELVHLFRRLMMTSGADPVTGKPPSLREIARRAGYAPSHVRNIINGKGRPSLDAVLAVAGALNAPAEDLQKASYYADQLQQSPRTESTNARRATRRSAIGPRKAEALLNWSQVAGGASGPLIGRDTEIERLGTWLLEASQGRGRFVMIEGEPGIGKSSLMRGAALEGVQRGCHVIWATCDELSQAFSLLPLVDAFDRQAPAPADGYPSAAEILRSGSAPGDQIDLARRATERLLVLTGQLCATTTVLLAVDDVQWADHATVAALARLARLAERSPLLVMTAVRPIPRRQDLEALRDLTRRGTLITLTGLSGAHVAELIHTIAAAVPGPKLLQLADGAGGNPLYLTELVDELARGQQLAVKSGIAEVTGTRASSSLSTVIAARIHFVSTPTREMLRTAALLGTNFSVPELSVASGYRAGQLLPRLDEAFAAGIIRDDELNLAFRHPLIRNALYDEMPPAVRNAWHLECARALADLGSPISQVARQLLPACDGGIPANAWATNWLANEGPQLVGQAPDAAVRLLRWVLTGISTTATNAPIPYDLLTCRLADALFRTGDSAGAMEVATGALAHVTDPDLMVDLHWTLTQCRALSGQSDNLVATLESALRSPGLGAQHRARLHVLIARTQRSLGHLEAAGQTAAVALDEANVAGDRWAAAWSMAVLFIVHVMRGEPAKATGLFEQASTTAEGDPTLGDLQLVLRINRAVGLGDLDRHLDAIHAARHAYKIAAGMGNIMRLRQAESVIIELHFEAGRWDEALAELAQASNSPSDPVSDSCNQGSAAVIQLHRDNEAAELHLLNAERAAQHVHHRTIVPLALARSLAHERARGLPAALAVLTDELVSEDKTGTVKLLADATRLATAVGDLDTARDLATQADSFGEDLDTAYRKAVSRHCRGLLNHDPALLAEAADLYRRAGRPLPQAQALEAAGVALADQGDTIRATNAFNAALSAYTLLAAAWDAGRTRQRLSQVESR